MTKYTGMYKHKRRFTKPDGRTFLLYGREPVANDLVAPSFAPTATPPNSHHRWRPLRGEWLSYDSHRQHRTFVPPPEYNPVAASKDSSLPTEIPAG